MLYYCILGAAAGVLNGLFGSGGGIAVVPMLRKAGLEQKKAHATSVAIILPLCVLSSFAYLSMGNMNVLETAAYLPGGIIGAAAGAFFIKKIDNSLLRRLFGLLLIISSYKILTR